MAEQAIGVMLVYMWSGYVIILKWSLEPLFCTGGFWDSDGGYMITQPSVAVRPPMFDLLHGSSLSNHFLLVSLVA